jgi:hypothetical protein
MEVETHGYDAEGHVGDDAREPTMRPARAPLTLWAPCRATSRGQLHDELVLVEADRIDVQSCPVRKGRRKEGSETHEGDSKEWDETTRVSALSFYGPSLEFVAPQLAKNQVHPIAGTGISDRARL